MRVMIRIIKHEENKYEGIISDTNHKILYRCKESYLMKITNILEGVIERAEWECVLWSEEEV